MSAVPSIIATTPGDVLFRAASPQHAEYHAQVLATVHETRIDVFLNGAAKASN